MPAWRLPSLMWESGQGSALKPWRHRPDPDAQLRSPFYTPPPHNPAKTTPSVPGRDFAGPSPFRTSPRSALLAKACFQDFSRSVVCLAYTITMAGASHHVTSSHVTMARPSRRVTSRHVTMAGASRSITPRHYGRGIMSCNVKSHHVTTAGVSHHAPSPLSR